MDLPAHKFLDERGIPYIRLNFPPETEKGAASVAEALGYEPGQMVKTLVFETGEGEQVLVMMAADKNAVSGNLKRAIGSRNIRLADGDAVYRVTGYRIGSIPPFHWQQEAAGGPVRSFIDAPLMREEVLGVGAGVWGEEIIITPERLVEASGAIIVQLSREER